MYFVYPQSIFNPRKPDELFRDEARAMAAAGYKVHLIDTDALDSGPTPLRPLPAPGSRAVYRSWMLTQDDYASVEQAGGSCFTSLEQYVATHYLPNWYPLVEGYTPETVFFDAKADLLSDLRQLGWERFFVRDLVESLKTSRGSIIDRPEQIRAVVAEMEKYQDFIECGLCVRRVEDFAAGSERRYFVLNGKAFAAEADAPIPEAVLHCAGVIPSPFFSVDVARRSDGVDRIVEIDDGQVSDLEEWSVERFVDIWRNAG